MRTPLGISTQTMLQCKSQMKPWMKRGPGNESTPDFQPANSNMDDLCGCTNHPWNMRLMWRSNEKKSSSLVVLLFIRNEIFTLYDIIHMFPGGKSLSTRILVACNRNLGLKIWRCCDMGRRSKERHRTCDVKSLRISSSEALEDEDHDEAESY